MNKSLHELARLVKKEKVRSVAMPRLATGVGGLSWSEVKPLVDSDGKKLPGWRVRAFAAGEAPRPGVPPPLGKVVSSTDTTDEGGAYSLALSPDSAPGEKDSTVYVELASPEGTRPELLVRVGPRDVPDLAGLLVAFPLRRLG